MLKQSGNVVAAGDKSLTTDAVIDFCHGKLASYKLPRVVEFIDDILREQFPGPAPE